MGKHNDADKTVMGEVEIVSDDKISMADEMSTASSVNESEAEEPEQQPTSAIDELVRQCLLDPTSDNPNFVRENVELKKTLTNGYYELSDDDKKIFLQKYFTALFQKNEFIENLIKTEGNLLGEDAAGAMKIITDASKGSAEKQQAIHTMIATLSKAYAFNITSREGYDALFTDLRQYKIYKKECTAVHTHNRGAEVAEILAPIFIEVFNERFGLSLSVPTISPTPCVNGSPAPNTIYFKGLTEERINELTAELKAIKPEAIDLIADIHKQLLEVQYPPRFSNKDYSYDARSPVNMNETIKKTKSVSKEAYSLLTFIDDVLTKFSDPESATQMTKDGTEILYLQLAHIRQQLEQMNSNQHGVGFWNKPSTSDSNKVSIYQSLIDKIDQNSYFTQKNQDYLLKHQQNPPEFKREFLSSKVSYVAPKGPGK